jgi:hypothetical protein
MELHRICLDFGLIACGVAGLVYVLFVLRHTLRQKEYQPVLEDWTWHCFLPFLAYATLLVSAIILPRHIETALFLVAGSTLLLLFIGIHNAWDTVTWMAAKRQGEGTTPP